MAWNEPGKPGQDPWGDNQRPPKKEKSSSGDDLALQLKQQLEKFMGSVGSKPSGNDSPEGQESIGVGVGVLVGIGFAVWMAFGVYIVAPAERGVVTVFGAFVEETGAGPHWNWPTPIGDVTRVDVEQIRNAEIGYRTGKQVNNDFLGESSMLTQDENIIDVKLAVQYNIRNAANYLYANVDPDLALREVVESAVRDVVGKSKMDFILTDGRSQLVARVKDIAQATLDSYKAGIQITSVNLQDAQPPEQVQSAFADVVKAREDRQRLINEAEAYSNDILPKARGQAARVVEEASAYRDQVIARSEGDVSRFVSIITQYQKAPEVTRQRLYLDTVEQVLGSTSKIVVSGKQSGQLMYLPLDKWMQDDKGQITTNPLSMNASGTLPEVGSTAAGRAQNSPSLRDNLRTRELR